MLFGILLCIHFQHDRLLLSQRAQSLASVEFSQANAFFLNGMKWGEAERHGGREVLSTDDVMLGYVIQTAPDGDRYLGFSGPSNLLVAFDTNDRIVGIQVLQSRDTRDHVELIRKNHQFFESWKGLSWSDAASRTKVDGVSGATLTSYAMIQGLQKRLGAMQVSQKFPKPLELADVQKFFADAKHVEQSEVVEGLWNVHDGSSRIVGAILRTSPAADEVIGYQGPTEARLAISEDGSVVGIAIADSFDNEPYVGYVRGDAWFAKTLKKYSISQWSQLDVEKEGIEGVSGATMTSVAVANGIVAAAKRYESEIHAAKSNRAQSIARFWRGVSTIAIIVAGLIIGLTALKGKSWLRIGFQVLVIVYLGLINGDLLSMAMFNGWAQSGIPWPNAIGLVALTLAAVVLPVVARTNIYCSHLCPHGAVQQLLPRRWKMKSAMPKWMTRMLVWIRPLLIAWVLLVCLLHLPFSLVDIEPFDAYSWRAAAWPTILIAIAGIAASFKVPMAYCQYGCATGAVLQYLRRHSRSDRWTRADGFALACMVVGVLLYNY